MNRLIENCYENKYKIDLRKIHTEVSKVPYNSRNATIYDEKFDRRKIVFYDGISSHFDITCYNGLIYLLGDKTCYPCGYIVEGAYDINWVQILVVPTGLEILTSSDIRKTSCVNMDNLRHYLPYLTKDNFRDYVEDYINSFNSSDWYDHNSLRILINSNNVLSIEDTFKELRKKNLLNPFELALGSIIYDLGITPIEVFNCLNYSKDIAPQFTYVDYFKTKFSLSGSTNQLIRTDEFKKVIETFDSNEIEQFFEVQYLTENLRFENFYSELMADVLQIRVRDRLCQSDPFCNSAQLLQIRFDKINISRSVVNEFYNNVKTNIRSLENQVRKNSGYREVGSIYNEMLIFKFFTDNFSTYDVVYQYSPQWLGRQRFDVYFKSLNVAIEYNGKQHYQPIDFFGGDQGFENLVRLDALKRKKCFNNNCILFEIKYDEDISHSLLNIKNEIEYYISKGERIT
jgi:hypothetical protein